MGITVGDVSLGVETSGDIGELHGKALEGPAVPVPATGGSGELHGKPLEGPAVPLPAAGGSGELQSQSPWKRGNVVRHHWRQW